MCAGLFGKRRTTLCTGWMATRLRALRAFSFPISVLPVLVAASAVRPWTQWHWDILVVSAAGVALLHCTGNLLNDYFDFCSGVDRRLEDDGGRPGRFLVRGELLPKDILIEAAVCMLALVPVAAYLLWRCGAALLWFGMAAAAAAYAYTGPPFELKYRALGEPLIFLMFGPLLLLGAAYAQTGRWEWPALAVSIPVGFATTAILVGNNLRDIDEDRAGHIRTLTLLAGERFGRMLYIALVIASTVAVSATGFVVRGTRLLVAAPVLLVLVGPLLARVWRGERVPNIDVHTARFDAALQVFLFAVLAWNRGLL